MTLKEYLLLDNIMKSMKRDIFVITPTMVLGTDKEFTTLSVVEMDMKIPQGRIYYIPKEFLNDIKEYSEKNPESCEEILDKNFLKVYGTNPLLEKLNRVHQLMATSNHVEEICDLRTIDEFNYIMGQKASAGGILFKFSRTFIMSIFKGLIPLNSADKIGVTVYMNSSYPSFLANYLIDKKKFAIKMYVEYLLV